MKRLSKKQKYLRITEKSKELLSSSATVSLMKKLKEKKSLKERSENNVNS